jgi:hypothetical protein
MFDNRQQGAEEHCGPVRQYVAKELGNYVMRSFVIVTSLQRVL